MRPFGCRIAVICLLGALLGLTAGSVCQAATFTGTVSGPDQQAVPAPKVWLARAPYEQDDQASVVATGQTHPNGAFSLTDPAFGKLDSPGSANSAEAGPPAVLPATSRAWGRAVPGSSSR